MTHSFPEDILKTTPLILSFSGQKQDLFCAVLRKTPTTQKKHLLKKVNGHISRRIWAIFNIKGLYSLLTHGMTGTMFTQASASAKNSALFLVLLQQTT